VVWTSPSLVVQAVLGDLWLQIFTQFVTCWGARSGAIFKLQSVGSRSCSHVPNKRLRTEFCSIGFKPRKLTTADRLP
jgi:hypothetical protein